MILNNYLKTIFIILLAITCNVAVFAAVTFNKQSDSTILILKIRDNINNRLIYNKTKTDFQTFMVKISAVKNPFETNKNIGLSFNDNQKPIDNVKIFPNPVSTQINISFFLNKDEKVVIKILDVLGNEVITLLNQKLYKGEQFYTFSINSRIVAGFYFVRIISGNDSVIKRISVI